MEQLNHRRPKLAHHQQTAQPAILPAQIWTLLNPQQQRNVFQLLVGVCQELLRHHPHDQQEVTDEPR